jgi:membrane associated rhomboid family serine protease
MFFSFNTIFTSFISRFNSYLTLSEPIEDNLFQYIKYPLLLVGIFVIVHIFQVISGYDLGYLGVFPRAVSGLRGIFFSPILHGDWAHLLSNAAPMLIMGVLMQGFYPRVALRAFTMIYFLTGVTVWLFARSVYHIGASGVVYGMVSFLFFNGIFRRSNRSIMAALTILGLYGGMFMGFSPHQEGISWESHLLGALVGAFTSLFYKDELEAEDLPQVASYANDSKEKHPFLPPDIFDKTKVQRRQELELLLYQQWVQDTTGTEGDNYIS